MIERNSTEAFIKDTFKSRGISIDSNAMKPFDDIPFAQLHEVYDHEEHFLITTLIESIIMAYNARTKSEHKQDLTAADVTSGILLLGKEVEKAKPEVFSHQQLIKEICPYCSN